MLVDDLPLGHADTFSRHELSGTREFEIPTESEYRLVAKNEPNSIGSELLRTLASRLNYVQVSHTFKKLLITSAVQGEGKTMMAANLSITLAMLNKRVLLVDGDLRSSSLSRWFDIVDVSLLAAGSDDRIYRAPLLRKAAGLPLWVLPAGKPVAGSSSLVHAAAIAGTLAAFESDFDWIIIDSPPVVPFGDAGALANAADAVLLVTRRGVTPKNMFDEALHTLDKKKIIATILNGANVRSLKYYNDYYGRAQRRLPGFSERANRNSLVPELR